MPERFTQRILRHTAHGLYQPMKRQALAADIGIPDDEREAFARSIEELIDQGMLTVDDRGRIGLPPVGDEVVGTIRVSQGGFGFVVPETPNAEGDLFVPPHGVGDAISGDRVRVRVVRERGRRGRSSGRSPYTGRVEEVLTRARTHFVGVLKKKGSQHLVIPDGRLLAEPIVIRDAGAKHASIGDKVVVEITRYPEDNALAEGVIAKVLGEPGKPSVETAAVINAYGLPGDFPEEVMAETRDLVARYQNEPESFHEGREDIQDEFLITIDPPDAQDFDDAISIKVDGKNVELGVHIADVAAFVTPGSALDDEAYRRANSVYLPRRVIPMLPEALSNGLCSLQPDVRRLARSLYLTYNDKTRVVGRRFCRSVIHSAHRLTYLEAQALIEGDETEARKHAKNDKAYTPQLIETLRQMEKLAKKIAQRRRRGGMIELDLPEVELLFDEEGHVIGAEPEDDSFTHKLIEMFMVEANEAVAQMFADLDVPLIRRIHPDPSAHDVTDMRAFAKVAGYHVPQKPSRKELQSLLNAVRDTPMARAIHFAVLRTMNKAEYAPMLIGHFALASEHYTHYTSPIRRYPDLTVHRALDVLARHLNDSGKMPTSPAGRRKLAKRVSTDSDLPGLESLRTMGSHCSASEIRATEAERELRDVLVMKMLAEKHVGDVFDGTVTGAVNRGLFVQLDKYLVEGLIGPEQLPGAPAQRWKFRKQLRSMVAEKSGRRIGVGDRFKVRIIRVDLFRRDMELMILEEPGGGGGGGGRSGPPKGSSPKPQRLHKKSGRSGKSRKSKGKSGGQRQKGKGGKKNKGSGRGSGGGGKGKGRRKRR
ncbi:MAG: ribonuclease R [Phycisphaeraceae bacterium]|nr:ribonuclease R [Phycisphaeraceae bacterium]